MDNTKLIVGESNCWSIGRNHNKIAMMAEVLNGREVSFMDVEGEEYKSLSDAIGVDINTKPKTKI